MSLYHTSVLLDESVSALVTDDAGTYVDATFGGGGHSREILSRLGPDGRLIAFDRDADALENRIEDPRFTLVHNNFRFVHNYVMLDSLEHGSEDIWKAGVDGILADLGVSSHQFDTAERGFSFRYDAPLDMRMGKESVRTAADIINGAAQEDLERIFRVYGEVENSRRCAELVVKARSREAIDTTGKLDAALKPLLPRFAEHKYLAKVYQALRIEVNGEMRSLEKFLSGAAASIKEGGRLVVITYHSLEDRMVKNFIRTGNVDGKEDKDIYGRLHAPFPALNRKPILPPEEEISANTRARSAKLRIATRNGE